MGKSTKVGSSKSEKLANKRAADSDEENSNRDEADGSGEEEEEYVVETVLNRRVRDGKVEYHLKWKGFSISEATWEPEDNMGCPELVEAFEKERSRMGDQLDKSKDSDTSKLRKSKGAAGSQKRRKDRDDTSDNESLKSDKSARHSSSKSGHNSDNNKSSSSSSTSKKDKDRKSALSTHVSSSSKSSAATNGGDNGKAGASGSSSGSSSKRHSVRARSTSPSGNDEHASEAASDATTVNMADTVPPKKRRAADAEKFDLPAAAAAATVAAVAPQPQKNGFEQGLQPVKILGASDASGELMFLIKWHDHDRAELVRAKEANVKCPALVIAFYEQRLTWHTDAETDDEKTAKTAK